MTNAYHHLRALVLAASLALLIPAAAGAHPLGNDNIEHFSVLFIFPDRLEVDFLLLIAETQSALIREDEIDADKDGEDTEQERSAWLEKKMLEFAASLKVTIDHKRLPLEPLPAAGDPETGKKIARRFILPMPGFAGMTTYNIMIRYAAPYPEPLAPGEHTITYEDTTYTPSPGLKRIILERTPGVEVIPPHPEFWNPDFAPTIYEQYDPSNLPQERSATIKFRVLGVSGPSAEAGAARPERLDELGLESGQKTPYQRQADRLLALLQDRLGIMMFLTLTGLAFGWGAAHAVMPGHAKTVVAAYLISQRGTYWHAVLLAIIVTITHTALVVILGLVIWVYQRTHPALGFSLQNWLGMISGLLVAGMGAVLIWRALAGRLAHRHHRHDDHHHHRHDDRSWLRKLFTHSHPQLPAHGHGHDRQHAHTHAHPEHDHAHTHDHASGHGPGSDSGEAITVRLLLVLGITGGIVPCPTATIIMLLGIGANVVVGALYVVGIFSLGLALTLMVVGFLALSSRRFAARVLSDAQHEGELTGRGRWIMLRLVPALSGFVVAALGGAITANYVWHMRKGAALFKWLG